MGGAFPGPYLPKDLQPHCNKNLKQGSTQDIVVCTHLSKINVHQDRGGPMALGPRKMVTDGLRIQENGVHQVHARTLVVQWLRIHLSIQGTWV